MSNTFKQSMTLVLALAAAVLLGVLAMSSGVEAEELASIEIEVSEDMYAFVFDESQVHEDGMPAYGSAFITQGYIYPAGTLNGSNGVLADGSAEFPDEVIGTWTCYGFMIGDGAYTETGAWVVSTQVLEFDETYDNSTIITQGMELVDINVEGLRAITGGTGMFNGVSGQAVQAMTGLNAGEGVVLSIELQLEN